MDKNNMASKLIINAFEDWVNEDLSRYRFADLSSYQNLDRSTLYHASLNPYIKTECDIQVKFGGFLEKYLMSDNSGLTVHAELNVYQENRSSKADLSVHDVSDGKLWIVEDPDPIIETLIAVIEVKFSNYKDPDLHVRAILKDLDKLSICLKIRGDFCCCSMKVWKWAIST